MPQAMTTTTTAIAGRYRLIDESGRSEHTVVWRAHDELLQREVAVKEIRPPAELPEEERQALVDRALHEARLMAPINTTAAVRVFDVVEEGGQPWIVHEVVDGPRLRAVAGRRGLPTVEVAKVGLAVLEALDTAHRVGVAHCAVTPDNVVMGSDGRIALTDFCVDTEEHGPAEPERDLAALGATLAFAAGRHPRPPVRDLVARLTAPGGEPMPSCPEVRRVLVGVVRDQQEGRPVPWLLDDRAEADDAGEKPVWPLLVTFLVVLAATAIVLSLVLQRGA